MTSMALNKNNGKERNRKWLKKKKIKEREKLKKCDIMLTPLKKQEKYDSSGKYLIFEQIKW